MLIPFRTLTKKYNMNVHGILHIGAHNCEELKAYTDYGLCNDKIIWVEANPTLVENNQKLDNTRIIKNFICCDTDIGTSKLNITNNGQSSSIFELGLHKKYYPSIRYINNVQVNNRRIDTMYKLDNIPDNFANFLNIDIEGGELELIKLIDWNIFMPNIICIEIIVNNFNEIFKSEIYKIISSKDYKLFSKLYNSVIFVKDLK